MIEYLRYIGAIVYETTDNKLVVSGVDESEIVKICNIYKKDFEKKSDKFIING